MKHLLFDKELFSLHDVSELQFHFRSLNTQRLLDKDDFRFKTFPQKTQGGCWNGKSVGALFVSQMSQRWSLWSQSGMLSVSRFSARLFFYHPGASSAVCRSLSTTSPTARRRRPPPHPRKDPNSASPKNASDLTADTVIHTDGFRFQFWSQQVLQLFSEGVL